MALLVVFLVAPSGNSRNFVQGVPILLWKNFESLVKIQDLTDMKFVLKKKKKKILKPKQIYILYTKKSQKEKKKRKKKKLTMWFIYH